MSVSDHSPDWQFRLDTLRRRRGVLVWTALAALAVAEAFVLGLPNLYRSSATLLVEGRLPDAVDGTDDINARLQTIKQEALSRGRLTDLIERFGLYGASGKGTASERAIGRMVRDTKVDFVNGAIDASGRPTTIAFTLSYVAKAPQTAADVTNALAEFFVEKNDTLREQQARGSTELLATEVAETKGLLDRQEARVRAYTAQNMGALPQQVQTNLAAVARLDSQMSVNNAERARLVDRRQDLQKQIAEIDARPPQVTDISPSAQLERAKLELQTYRAHGLSESHPDVRLKEAEIAQLERQQTDAARRSAATLAAATTGPSPRNVAVQQLQDVEAQLKKIDGDNTALRTQIASYEGRVNSAPAHEPVFEGLLRDLQSTRDRYDLLMKRYDEARLNAKAETGDNAQQFRVLDPATVASAPAGPAKPALLALGALLALVLGVGAAILIDRRDTSFHSIDDLRSFTRVPVLVTIPEIASTHGRLARRTRAVALAGVSALALMALAAAAFYLAHGSDQVVRVLSRVS